MKSCRDAFYSAGLSIRNPAQVQFNTACTFVVWDIRNLCLTPNIPYTIITSVTLADANNAIFYCGTCFIGKF